MFKSFQLSNDIVCFHMEFILNVTILSDPQVYDNKSTKSWLQKITRTILLLMLKIFYIFDNKIQRKIFII